ncbi:MAG: hypothetical protein M3O03_07610 [Pseudomonadota bacterium]|nr:hypothetical protein [Pseudomonadota bacterium]
MNKILTGLVVLSVLVQPSLAFADRRQAGEPQGAAREAQLKKATEYCQKKYNGQYSTLQIVARWESHYGKTGWWCDR